MNKVSKEKENNPEKSEDLEMRGDKGYKGKTFRNAQ